MHTPAICCPSRIRWRRRARVRPEALVGDRVAARVDRADRLEHAIDVGDGDQAIVGTEQGRKLVADRSLEVAQDLGPVRIVLQAGGGPVEVSRKSLIGVLFEPKLLDVSAQLDRDRLVHGLPSQFVDE